MAPWANTDKSEYLSLDLRAHSLLKDVPLHDVWRCDLPGGGSGRTVADVHSLQSSGKPSGIVNFLFAFRWFLGRVFGWDKESTNKAGLFQSRLTEEDQTKSEVSPGTKSGPFTLLYVFPKEALSEIRNKTVHAALVWVLIPKPDGYRLFWGIYVKPVSWLTTFYMGLIKPFRHMIVYPSIFRRLHKAWRIKYQSAV